MPGRALDALARLVPEWKEGMRMRLYLFELEKLIRKPFYLTAAAGSFLFTAIGWRVYAEQADFHAGEAQAVMLLLMELHMNPFKGRHFQRDIILWAVRWYCKYGISYRELQEMLAERGVNVDHSTIYRWVQRYAPEMEKRLRWYWRNPSDLCPWHMDETYVKVNGRWAYLYRAVDSRGRTVDFYLSSRRNSKAAYRFLGKILNNVKKWQIPRFINTDKAPAYGRALALLKREGRCPSDVEDRQIKYRNNVIECDHGKLDNRRHAGI